VKTSNPTKCKEFRVSSFFERNKRSKNTTKGKRSEEMGTTLSCKFMVLCGMNIRVFLPSMR
jgi:hypothetical protein